MMNFYALWLKLGAIKDILYRKLSNIKAIDSFEEVDGELKVRDPEGFVAIDPIGNAVKVVDRLDFSRKNFMKGESIELDFVNDLMTEARMFRSKKKWTPKYSARDMADNAFAHMIALQVLNREFKYPKCSKHLCKQNSKLWQF